MNVKQYMKMFVYCIMPVHEWVYKLECDRIKRLYDNNDITTEELNAEYEVVLKHYLLECMRLSFYTEN
jgi:hypothetical protein